MRTATTLLLAVGLAAGGAWWVWGRSGEAVSWRTVEVERQDVRKVVTATGTLDAVTTVEVGTQVSGILAEILVDYNDRVTKGQLLARIDPALLEADVASASARVAEAEASAGRVKLELDRIARLHERQAATDQELEAARAEEAVARAQVQSAQVALSRARRNLAYTAITAPIDGTVVERAVEPGQTVNAGLSAPTLFVLAGDLARMQILAAVDESDIGQIQEGQPAEFTVQAWPERTFRGTVRQVRLQSTTAESVVTYTVVVNVENTDGVLLPGMTASVEFIVAEAPDVLCVPNAALRYRPDAEIAVVGAEAAGGGPASAAPAAGTSGEAGGAAPVAGTNGGSPGGGSPGGAAGSGSGAGAGSHAGAGDAGSGSGRGGRRGRGAGAETVVYLPEGDALRRLPVKTGLRGATCTEVSGEGVVEGLTAVVGVDRATTGSATTNPLQPSSSGGGQRRPGGF